MVSSELVWARQLVGVIAINRISFHSGVDHEPLGWIHRSSLARRDVTQMGKCKYLEVIDEGLVIERDGKREVLAVGLASHNINTLNR